VGIQIWGRLGADETVLAILAALPSDYIKPQKHVQNSYRGRSFDAGNGVRSREASIR
jgi:hypothetical protein